MYSNEPYWYDQPRSQELDRLTHLVLVDGRLVDTWSEPVEGTRWQQHAERFDRELRRAQEPPPAPEYERALQWLDNVCGGRAAVAALDAEPLVEDGLDLPEVPDRSDRERLEDAAALLDAVAERWFDTETSFALRRALLRVWTDDPGFTRSARSASHLAGGVCWAVGKANGQFGQRGGVTMSQVQGTLGLGSSITDAGQKVRAVLCGLRSWPGPSGAGTWYAAPRLEALGHADLLTATTRAQLIRIRDQAFAAASAIT
jgi:hypothetical protein